MSVMGYKFFWGDGQVELTSAIALNHLNLLQRLVDRKKLPAGRLPSDYAAGYFDPNVQGPDRVRVIWQGGNPPDEDALSFILSQDIENYQPERYQRFATGVEDTEPEYNFGFLTEPHSELYPAAWEGEKMRHDCKKSLKAHVLNSIDGSGQLAHADQWIYFTVYGSGASYNWDEAGDFDVQMWVDITKYNEHHPDAPMEGEELLKEIRRQVQLVNFPSFADLGLDTPECDGAMLIQFYPKLGTGTTDENEAQKPYACYDIETDEWIVKPKPITPEFYGQHFVMVMDRCQDVADQAKGLIDQFQRNVLTWQFFTKLYSQTKNKLFLSTAEKAQIDATTEQEGIANLFQGVFGARQHAYSPEGEGIEDEGDVTQKLLEVWGIFQQLKHWARAPLPWDKQEMPSRPIDELSQEVVSSWKEAAPTLTVPDGQEVPSNGTFGYLNGHLILGYTHHKAIMGELINQGWTWDQLLAADQAWGWYDILGYMSNTSFIQLRFTSDSGYQSATAMEGAKKAFEEKFGMPVEDSGYTRGVRGEKGYGTGLGRGRPKPGYGTQLWGDVPDSPEPRPLLPTHMYLPNFHNSGKIALKYDPEYIKKQELPWSGCFGYIGNHLILGDTHHKAIIGSLIEAGWTWDQLMSAPQAWGWFQVNHNGEHDEKWKFHPDADHPLYISVQFTSDSGFQNEDAITDAKGAFARLYHINVIQSGGAVRGVPESQYGTGLGGGKPKPGYKEDYISGDGVPAPPPVVEVTNES